METANVTVELPANLFVELQLLTAQENAGVPVEMIARLVAQTKEKASLSATDASLSAYSGSRHGFGYKRSF